MAVFLPGRNLVAGPCSHGCVCLVSLSDEHSCRRVFNWDWRVSPSWIALSVILGSKSDPIRSLQKVSFVTFGWLMLPAWWADGQAEAPAPSLMVKPSRPWNQIWLYVKGFVLSIQKCFWLTKSTAHPPKSTGGGGGGGGGKTLFVLSDVLGLFSITIDSLCLATLPWCQL